MGLYLGNGARFFHNGAVLQNGKVNVYVVGTTDRKDIFTDEAMTVASPNPATTNENGEVELYWQGSAKVVVTTEGGTEVESIDSVETLSSGSLNFVDRAEAQSGITGTLTMISVAGLLYQYDAAGTALTTGDGRTWSPLGNVTPQHFGALGSPNDDTAVFNTLIAWINSRGNNGVYASGGTTVYLGDNHYSLLTGLNPVAVDGCTWQGAGLDATFINVQAGTLFDFGEGNIFIDSVRVTDMSIVCDTALTPNANLKICAMRHGTRLTIDNIKMIRVPQLAYLYADPAENISNIKISDVVGEQYDAGVALIECFKDVVGYTGGAGAGLYLDSVRVNLTGVAATPESDGTVAHTATVGAAFLKITSFWDTVIAKGCVSNRHWKGLHLLADVASFGISNMYFDNCIIDYAGENAIHLETNGGNISKFNFSQGWLNSTEGHTVHMDRTGGLFDFITISDCDLLMAGLNNFEVADGCTNVSMESNRLWGCGRKQLISASPTKTSHGFNIGIGCDGLSIKNNRYRDGFNYYGGGSYPLVAGDYDPDNGINLASVAMQFDITNNRMRGVSGGYSWTAADLLATANTSMRTLQGNVNDDGTKADYLGFGLAAVAASGVAETNRTGCTVVYNIRGGTVSQIDVSGTIVAVNTDQNISVGPGDTITITYTVAPPVVRQLLH